MLSSVTAVMWIKCEGFLEFIKEEREIKMNNDIIIASWHQQQATESVLLYLL